MKQAPNYQGGNVAAYNQFLNDLKADKDFIAFKQHAFDTKTGCSYGVVIVRTYRYAIEKPINNQSIS